MDAQLKAFLDSAKSQGKSAEEIRQTLLSSGWPASSVEQIIKLYFPQVAAANVVTTASALENNPPKKKRSIFKILLLILAPIITLGVIGVIILLFFPQIYLPLLINIEFSRSKHPAAYLYPTERTINVSSSPSNFQELDYPGIKLKVPWKETPQVSEKAEVKTFVFPSSGTLLLISMPYKQGDFLKAYTGQYSPQQIKQIETVMGENTLSSHYNFTKVIYNSSPPQVSFTNTGKAMAQSVLFGLKAAGIASYATDGFYSFSINNYRGFQMGNPDVSKSANRATHVDLFDDKDQYFNLIFLGQTLTQSDIDFVLSSIQPGTQ